MHVFLSSLFFFVRSEVFLPLLKTFTLFLTTVHTARCFLPLTSLEQRQQPVLLGGIIYFFSPPKCALMLCFAFLPGIQASHAVSFVSGSFSNNRVRCRAVNTSGPLLFPQAKLNEAKIFYFFDVKKNVKVTATFFSLDIKLSDLTLVLIKFTRNCL